MSSSKIVALLGVLLLVGFFLPWIAIGGESQSGLDYALAGIKSESNQWVGYVLLLAPIGALLAVILGAVGKPHGLVAFFTGLVCPILFGLFYIGSDAQSLEMMGNAVSYGFWITMAASVLLLVFSFTKSESKLRARRL